MVAIDETINEKVDPKNADTNPNGQPTAAPMIVKVDTAQINSPMAKNIPPIRILTISKTDAMILSFVRAFGGRRSRRSSMLIVPLVLLLL